MTFTNGKWAEDDKGFYDLELYLASGNKWRPLDVHNGELVVDNRFYQTRRAQFRTISRFDSPAYRSGRKADLHPIRRR